MLSIINEKIFDDIVCSFKHAGMVVAKGESVIYHKCSGSVSIDSVFNIGSISKVFAAVGILILKDWGKVDIDGKVVDYLPDFSMEDFRYKDITLRMLLNHSSGLRGTSFTGGAGYKFCDVKKQFMENLHNSSLQYDPGFTRIYCNDGFFLSQILIEKMSGLDFCDFIEKYVSEKIGLKHVGRSVGEVYEKNSVMPCYTENKKLPYEYISTYGVAGLSSSLIDLCKFSFNLYNNENILSKESQKELFSTQYYTLSKLLKEGSCFGMPWDLIIDDAFVKQGNTSQYSSLLYSFPENNISISFVVLTSEYLKLDKKAVLAAFPHHNAGKDFLVYNSIKEFDIYNFVGYYASKYDILEMKYSEKSNLLEIISHISGSIRRFSNVKENCFSELGGDNKKNYTFKKICGKKYFCEFDRVYNLNIIRFEELNISDCGLNFEFIKENLNNELWFRINDNLYEVAPSRNTTHMTRNHVIKSKVYEKFKLIDFENMKKFISYNKAVPVCLGTGQSELKLNVHCEKLNSVSLNDRVYVSRNNILRLNPRSRRMKFTNQSEWLEILTGCKIKIICYRNDIRFLVFSDSLSVIYDSLVRQKCKYIFCKSSYFIEFINAKYADVYYYRNKKMLIIVH